MAAEKKFENRIKEFLQSIGVYALGTPVQKMTVPPIGYYEKRWGSKMTASGLPDMHIIINGWSYEVEIKAPNGKASELQKHMIEQINNAGCRGVVLYEDSMDIPNDGFEHYMSYKTFMKVIKMYASQL